jgi:hypothetical protein
MVEAVDHNRPLHTFILDIHDKSEHLHLWRIQMWDVGTPLH